MKLSKGRKSEKKPRKRIEIKEISNLFLYFICIVIILYYICKVDQGVINVPRETDLKQW